MNFNIGKLLLRCSATLGRRHLSISRCHQSSSRKYGQPTEWTHSHILGKNEVNHGISRDEFRARRENIVEKLLRHKPGGSHLLILPAARKQFMVEKIPYFFRNLLKN